MNDSPAADAPIGSGETVRVTTGSRLHFGLLDTAAPFGGVGVMIQAPATQLVIRHAAQFQCDDQVRDRIEPIARRIQQLAGNAQLPACRIEVTDRPNEHWGLGSGTQLALSVAEGLATFCGLDIAPVDLATTVAERGKRSAVGVHGYFRGGLIYEEADAARALNPIQSQLSLPDRWCVALFQPTLLPPQVSGAVEQQRFKQLGSVNQKQRQQLRTIVTDQLIPAAQSGQFAEFGEAVHQYNRASGLLFDSIQGGPYNGAGVTDLVDLLTQSGAQGVGQSSWGPSVFAWFESAEGAHAFEQQIPTDIQRLAVSPVKNDPRELCTSG